MFDFDIIATIRDSIISAIVFFFIGIYTKRKLGYNLGNVISFVKCFFIFIMLFLIFWLNHQTPSAVAIIDLSVFLTEYIPSCVIALLGLAIGDLVGSILENPSQSVSY